MKNSPVQKNAMYFLLFFALILGLGLLGIRQGTANLYPNLPIDYGNYLRGTQMLYQGENPYTEIEFFAPPWIAFFLTPFYLLYSPIFWQISCAVFIGLLIYLATRHTYHPSHKKTSLFLSLFLFFLPTTLFAIILGQLSPLMGLVIFVLYKRITNAKLNTWEIAFGIILLTLKPHVVFLPAVFIGLELLRRKDWHSITLIAVTIFFLGIISSALFYKNWLPALFNAIFVGAKYIEGADLAASFHKNFASVDIPAWFFLPHLFYVIHLWTKKGFHTHLFLLLSALNFLLMPYTRQYDFVILLPAYFYIFSKLLHAKYYLPVIVLGITLYFLPFFTQISFITPAIILGLLLFFPAYNKIHEN